MKYFVIFLTLIVASVSWGRLSDGQIKVELQEKKLVATALPGFHFNKDAPAGLAASALDEKPTQKEEAKIVFSAPKIQGPFKVNFWVCDDKKTVCEEHVYNYQIKNEKLVAVTGQIEKALLPDAKKSKPSSLVYDSHGFIVNDLEGALAKAKKEKKLLFVDYGAPWCPACVRLDTEVFGTKVFKKATQSVIKLVLVSDMLANKEFGKKYNIKVLPTMLVLNGQGEELYRDITFRNAADLSADLAAQFKKKSLPWAAIEKQAEAGDKAAMKQMAEQAFSAFDMPKALVWYAKIQEMNPKYAYAETTMWSEKDLKEEKNRQGYIEVLKKWIAHDPQGYTAITARTAWAELYAVKSVPTELTVELKKNLEILKTLASNPMATKKLFKDWGVSVLSPYEQEEIYAQWLSSAKALKQETKEIQASLQGLLKAKDLSIQRPGEVLEGLPYFRQAEMPKEEGEWLLKLLAAHPDSYVYHMKLAAYYVRQKDFAKALPEAEKAVELGEDRRIQNLQQLAKIQKELKQNEEAKKSIDRALAMPEAKLEQYKSVATSLEELKKSL